MTINFLTPACDSVRERTPAPSARQPLIPSTSPSPASAFSLIEVILAIGVTSFALLGIFALFSTSLKTNKDSSSQQEGFEVQRMLLSKLQDTNQFPSAVMRTLFGQIYQVRVTNSYFIYTLTNSGTMTTTLTNVAPASVTNYSGNLYYIRVSASSNLPSSMSNIFQNYIPGAAVPVANWTNWPSLPIHATVYSIPTPTATNATVLSNLVPVTSFDLFIPK